MLFATFLGIFFVPVFFVLVRSRFSKGSGKGKGEGKPQDPKPAPHAVPQHAEEVK
jgi:hypothetical protein